MGATLGVVPVFPRFLDRFRRLLAPAGRPSEALGVPASGADLEAELAPLLPELDRIDEEAQAIRAEARERVQRRGERASHDAAAILASARGDADAERTRSAAAARARTRERGEAAGSEAAREVERIHAVQDERVEQLVSEVLECIWRSGR